MKSQIEREHEAVRRATRKKGEKLDDTLNKVKNTVEEFVEDEIHALKHGAIIACIRLVIKILTHLVDDHHTLSQLIKSSSKPQPKRRARPKPKAPRSGEVS